MSWRCAQPAAGRSSTSPFHPIRASRRWRTRGRRAPLLRRSAGPCEVLGGRRVSVTALALGRFATESLRKYPVELWRRRRRPLPLQRLGTLEEYGWLVALLASPLGPALSGSVVTLDGALDNWTGPWPPPDLVRDGQVPTEERRPAVGDRSDPRRPPDPATIPPTRGRGVNGCTRAFQALGTGSTPVARSLVRRSRSHGGGVESFDHGEWRSLVAHPAGGRAVAGSNPVSPMKQKAPLITGFLCAAAGDRSSRSAL